MRSLAVGLALAPLLALLRGAVVVAMDLGWRGHEFSAVLLRLDVAGPRIVLAALVASVFAAACVGRLGALRGGLPAAAALFVVLSGVGWDSAYHVPDVRSAQGRGALAALGGAALIGALALTPLARRGGGARAALAGVILAFSLPLGLHLATAAPRQMRVSTLVLDLPRSMERLNIVRAREDAPPESTVLTPARGLDFDGADQPALRLSPPAAVEFTVTQEEGPVTFVAAAGIDRRVRGPLRGAPPSLRITLRARRNGEVVFEYAVDRADLDDGAARAWRGFEVELEPGDVLRLETDVDADVAPLPVGFAGCVLERRTSVPRTRSSPESPSLLYIVMDTLRMDRTSLGGYALDTTPRLAALAARGVLAEQAYAPSSWTWPSTASLLTGLPVEAHGLLGVKACHLDASHVTLAEALQARGITTAAFIGNPLIVAEHGFDQGFEHFQATDGVFLASEFLVPDALAWLGRHAGTRFFLYAHLVDPHPPYWPLPEHLERFTSGRPPEFPEGGLTDYQRRTRAAMAAGEDPRDVVPEEHGRWMNELYDASVATADTWVGRLLDHLEELGIADETVVVFTSDHGEELGDHSQFGHGHSLHAELVRVPLVIAGPGIPAGVRVTEPVSNRHLAPALARLGGTELAGLGDVPDLLAGRVEGAPVLFSTRGGWVGGQQFQHLLGLRSGDRVVHVHVQDGTAHLLGLFDAAQDVAQRRDLVDLEPDLARALADEAFERARSSGALAPRVRAAGAGALDTLRQLGYVGDGELTDPEDG